MDWSMLGNPVLLSVVMLLALSALRLNVVFSLILASVFGGVIAGLGTGGAVKAFYGGLGGGAGIAMNYAMLGAFSIAISRSGVTELIAQKLFACIGRQVTQKQIFCFKYSLIAILTLIAISSQNLIPVHIAFIPVLIPPLLPVFERIRLDRRMVACILTFGLITPYMVLPVGFGKIYINEVVLGSIRKSGMDVLNSQAPGAMLIPADHGNADDMYEHDKKGAVKLDKNGAPKRKTAHSLNPVPCIIVDPESKGEYSTALKSGLGISSVATTCMELLGYLPPADYDPSIIEFK